MFRRAVPLFSCIPIMIASCTVGPDYQAPQTQVPSDWHEPPANGVTSRPADVEEWWTSFQDPTLDSLVRRSVDSNLELRAAQARIRQARAERTIVSADLWPQLNVSGSHAYRGPSLNASPKPKGSRTTLTESIPNALSTFGQVSAATSGVQTPETAAIGLLGTGLRALGGTPGVQRDMNLFQAGFDASWELDVFGGIRRGVEAAEAQIQAAEEDRRDVLVTLLSEVARNYVELRGAQRRLAIARENIQSQRETVQLTQARFDSGLTSELDVTQAKGQLATTESQVPAIEVLVKLAAHRLSVLIGNEPGALLAELEPDGPIPVIPTEIPAGLPSDLLRRRPDIRRAERQVAAATARIGVATADLFPRFSLTGTFGTQTRDIRHFLDARSAVWSVGPAVSWPIFQGGRIRANIEFTSAQQQELFAVYEGAVLSALENAENALVAFSREIVRHRLLGDAVAANRRAVELASERYSRGLEDFLTVLESQRGLYTSQDAMIQSEQRVASNLIAFYKALGGGWESVERSLADAASPGPDDVR